MTHLKVDPVEFLERLAVLTPRPRINLDSYDGMQTNNLSGTGSTTYITNPATVQETVVETGGISAESNASGLSINMIPKEGGITSSSAPAAPTRTSTCKATT